MSDTPRKYAQCTREEWFERWEAWTANDYIAEEEQMAMRDCFAHIEELERENADLRAKLEAEHDIRADRETVITLLAESLNVNAEPHQSFFDRLCEAAEEATKDAERYRHLRDHGGADLFGGTASMSIGKHPMIVYFAPSLNHANMVSLFAENADYMVDAAIDAAIAQGGKP